MRREDALGLSGFLAVCYLAGFAGSIFTSPNLGWYSDLTKPSFTPPDAVFFPVWIGLYTLMGISAFLIWREDHPNARRALAVFALQLGANALWSAAFFGQRSPLAGLAVIILLWALIALTIIEFRPISKTAAFLLLPYILWTSLAAALNFAIWMLN
jgi:benzodiazapine receptor